MDAENLSYLQAEFSSIRGLLTDHTKTLASLEVEMKHVRSSLDDGRKVMEESDSRIEALEAESAAKKNAWSGPRKVAIGLAVLGPFLGGLISAGNTLKSVFFPAAH